MFIELTGRSGNKFVVNSNAVTEVHLAATGKVIIYGQNDWQYTVEESYDRVKELFGAYPVSN